LLNDVEEPSVNSNVDDVALGDFPVEESETAELPSLEEDLDLNEEPSYEQESYDEDSDDHHHESLVAEVSNQLRHAQFLLE
jgi:hypothetical protein